MTFKDKVPWRLKVKFHDVVRISSVTFENKVPWCKNEFRDVVKWSSVTFKDKVPWRLKVKFRDVVRISSVTFKINFRDVRISSVTCKNEFLWRYKNTIPWRCMNNVPWRLRIKFRDVVGIKLCDVRIIFLDGRVKILDVVRKKFCYSTVHH